MDEDEEELRALVEEQDPDSLPGAAVAEGNVDCSNDGSEVRHRAAPRKIRSANDRWANGAAGAAASPSGPGDDTGFNDLEDTASLHKFWHRAGWLVLLLLCQSTSSVILEHFQFLIRSHPIVIYFLTMLVGAGGNAGSQSTVLVVRQLALAAAGGKNRGASEPRLSLRRIVGAEVWVGARLAVVLFLASFVRCIAFQVRGVECLAICLSMFAIVFTSTAIGAALPLLLNRYEVDPAHAGATIQVIMDISGVTLTCVVSCLVLGMPLSDEAASAQISMGQNSTQVRTASISIQNEGRQELQSFGGDVHRYQYHIPH
mmetsp:Transcript_132567/g.296422  ORF Transcript_132567/g.296422 Transcript_132567/m.296422 type:complete len:315 (+) Transcript_132567:67-1011(+)